MLDVRWSKEGARVTDPAMRDPEQNFAYYRGNIGYEKNDARYQESRVKWIASRLVGARRILDLGANDAFVSKLCPDAYYVGIELNAFAVKHADVGPKVEVLVDNIVTVDYERFRDTFDVIVCTEVLEHLPDPLSFLKRIRVALKPDGRLVTTSPVGPGARFEPGNKDHLREWTGNEYRKLHEIAGYKVSYYGVERVYEGRFTHCVEAKLA